MYGWEKYFARSTAKTIRDRVKLVMYLLLKTKVKVK
jgi:hypothetical protein